jgi:hypothetical protein
MIPCVIVQILIGVKVQDTCTHQFMEQILSCGIRRVPLLFRSVSPLPSAATLRSDGPMIRTALVLAANTHEQETLHAVLSELLHTPKAKFCIAFSLECGDVCRYPLLAAR